MWTYCKEQMKMEVVWMSSGAGNIAGLDMFLGMMAFRRTEQTIKWLVNQPKEGKVWTHLVIYLKKEITWHSKEELTTEKSGKNWRQLEVIHLLLSRLLRERRTVLTRNYNPQPGLWLTTAVYCFLKTHLLLPIIHEHTGSKDNKSEVKWVGFNVPLNTL